MSAGSTAGVTSLARARWAQRIAMGAAARETEAWANLTDDTLVEFDGEPVRFGDLAMQDRKCLRYDLARDRIVGEYPL